MGIVSSLHKFGNNLIPIPKLLNLNFNAKFVNLKIVSERSHAGFTLE